MGILISHWHCIIPAAAILLAVVFMQIKGSGKWRERAEQDDQFGNGNIE